MSPYFPMVRIMLWLCIFQSLSGMDNPAHAGSVNKQVHEVNHALLTEKHPLFDHVRAIMNDLARAVGNLWRTILGQPLDLGNDPGLPPGSLDQQLFEVRRHIERLDHVVTEQIEDPLWQSTTETQRAMLHQLKRNTSEALAIDTVAGGGGIATAAWLHSLNPVATLRKLETMRFFTGFELPAAIGIIKPLLTPVVVLIVGAIVYSKVKNFFLYEYKEQTQERIRELEGVVKRHHEAEEKGLDAHKKEMAGWIAKHEGRMNDAISQARHNIIHLQHEADANNKRLDGLIAEVQKDISAQIADVQRNLNQQLDELRKTDTKHSKALDAQQATLKEHEQRINDASKKLEEENIKIKQYFKDLQEIRTKTAEHLAAQTKALEQLGKDAHAVGDVNAGLKNKMGLVIPKLEKIVADVAKLRKHTEQELQCLEYVRQTVIPYVRHKQDPNNRPLIGGGSVALYLPPPPPQLALPAPK